MINWPLNYIGIPYKYGGKSPRDGFDCWTFFCYIQKEHYSRIVGETVNDIPKDYWISTDDPKDGDAVLLGLSSKPSHIGIYITNPDKGIIHCNTGLGVCFIRNEKIKYQPLKVNGYFTYK